MIYPKNLRPGATIGVCAPSSGVQPSQLARLDNAIKNVRALGYEVIGTPSVRCNSKCVSADASTRAAEFMSLWENPAVAAIIPPWGGEFLMDMLPHLDWDKLAALPPKWLCGYSDTSTLCFALTTKLGIATLHGSNFMNLGFREIDPHDLRAFEAMSCDAFTQQSASHYGHFRDWDDIAGPVYVLDKPSMWQTILPWLPIGGVPAAAGEGVVKGRILGGCLDTLCKLLGTPYAPVTEFLRRYPGENFIWTLESCEMKASDIYRSLWQMRQAGWFERCAGVLMGRPDGYGDTHDFTLEDALRLAFEGMEIPVLTGCDIGHIPPQMQFINGAHARIEYADGQAAVWQEGYVC